MFLPMLLFADTYKTTVTITYTTHVSSLPTHATLPLTSRMDAQLAPYDHPQHGGPLNATVLYVMTVC
jgi:hypothetical protein